MLEWIDRRLAASAPPQKRHETQRIAINCCRGERPIIGVPFLIWRTNSIRRVTEDLSHPCRGARVARPAVLPAGGVLLRNMGQKPVVPLSHHRPAKFLLPLRGARGLRAARAPKIGGGTR